MSPRGGKPRNPYRRVPRASGDEPDFSQLAKIILECSPRERG